MDSHVLCLGGEDHALRIPFLLALRDRGFRVTAASSGGGEPFRAVGLTHLPWHFDRFDRRGGDLGAIARIASLVAECRPDLIQTFDTKPNLLAPLAVRGAVPVIRTINGMGWTFSPGGGMRARLIRPVYRLLQRATARWSAATVFQNADDKAYFERHGLVSRDAAHLVRSSGIDVAAFRTALAASRDPGILRQELGLGDAQVVVTVSRLTRQKGIGTLLKAARIVARARPRVKFLLVGPRESEGPFAIDAAEIEAAGPNVMALGHRRDVPALLALADAFVLPTQYREGVPRALLEAGLAGLPMVATRMPGCTDVVTEGWNGHLVEPGDAAALAQRILGLLEDPAEARVMGLRSIAFVARAFSLEGVVDSYRDIYRQMLRPRIAPVRPAPAVRELASAARADGERP
ncbi:MAG: glycosyltransferase family 4 protein [Phreatobacter sp.]|uniref:glycosyltransferase family 4 protein n=1 Tax=Phreatobacter sp. TaxID=1966341 RepID=UPI001A62A18F|nr:glycosyltransferase family 4 protein [Phreatobacter sp.]MBL8568672.1 glycosyltransferase family 4 protein [Phreatobacter sp.]